MSRAARARAMRFAAPHLRHRADLRRFALGRANHELQAIAGFFEQMSGQDDAVLVCRRRASRPSPGRRSEPATARRRPFRWSQSIGGYQRAGRGDVRRLGGLSQRRGAARRLDRLARAMRRRSRSRPPPGAGSRFRADFGVLWLCRFAEDVQDLEEFMAMLFALRTLRADDGAAVTLRSRSTCEAGRRWRAAAGCGADAR